VLLQQWQGNIHILLSVITRVIRAVGCRSSITGLLMVDMHPTALILILLLLLLLLTSAPWQLFIPGRYSWGGLVSGLKISRMLLGMGCLCVGHETLQFVVLKFKIDVGGDCIPVKWINV